MNWGKGIEEVQVQGETIHVKKGIFGWSIFHPIMIQGKINYKNLILGGSWGNFLFSVGIVLVILLATYEYSNTLKILQECLARPINILLP